MTKTKPVNGGDRLSAQVPDGYYMAGTAAKLAKVPVVTVRRWLRTGAFKTAEGKTMTAGQLTVQLLSDADVVSLKAKHKGPSKIKSKTK